jgi:HB1, ASXL, restriction endonuclease HTH domain
MATKKKQQATRASAKRPAKGRPAKARNVDAAATAAATQVKYASAEVAEMGTTPAPELAPPAAETPEHVDEGLNRRAGAKKLSALDAAVRVLEESGQPMNCQELIAAMAAKGYWSSPKGRTPAGTLYSAILRELQSQGEQARFVKTQRGKFAQRGTV